MNITDKQLQVLNTAAENKTTRDACFAHITGRLPFSE